MSEGFQEHSYDSKVETYIYKIINYYFFMLDHDIKYVLPALTKNDIIILIEITNNRGIDAAVDKLKEWESKFPNEISSLGAKLDDVFDKIYGSGPDLFRKHQPYDHEYYTRLNENIEVYN